MSLRLFLVFTLIFSFLLTLVIVPFLLSSPNQYSSLDDIKSNVDAYTNTCFKELRENLPNNLVYLEGIDNQTNFLINKYDGYSIVIPKSWNLDNVNYEQVTILYDADFKLSIFKQEIDRSYDSNVNYIRYSTSKICENRNPIKYLGNETKILGQFQVDILSWKRERVYTLKNDLNFYFAYNIVLDDFTVFTFILKSNKDYIEYYTDLTNEIIANMIFINQESGLKKEISNKTINDLKFSGEKLTFKLPKEKIVFGIFHKYHVDFWDELIALETAVDYGFEFIMDYYHFAFPFKSVKNKIYEVYSDGRVMLVTLQPYLSINMTDRSYDGSVLIPKIVNGDYDEYILDWAAGLRDLNEPVFLRFGNEMNGDWTEWCSWNYGLDPDLFIMAWTRIYALFQEMKADNVEFVWNPHDRDYPDYDWNSQFLYYPGDSKVDWIGLTAYNNGVTRPNETWREFDEAYSDLYLEYMNRYSSKSFIITEFACNEIGGDKARWIEEGMNSLSVNYPNIRIAVWWNGIDDTWIYDIDSSEASKEAFADAMKNSYFYRNSVSTR